MRHLGDITKISGYTAPIVDCIIGGSPCQDLSVAGKRAGLDGERSGLYIEQVRIVKEMRKRDELNGRTGVDVRPRYMVWENVPGAFSSNKGEDFRIVLEEIAKVCDKDAVIPMPDKGKWTNHGCILGDGWSVAWRVLDAQFWGVPQRRRRIALVADFGGHSAPEILFVRESVSGHSDESLPKRKATPSDASGGVGADDRDGTCLSFHLTQDPITNTKCTPCISSGNSKSGQASIGVLSPVSCDCYNRVIEKAVACSYNIGDRFDVPTEQIEKSHTLTARMGTGGNNVPAVCYGIGSYHSNAWKSDNPHSGVYEADTSKTLDLNGGNPSCNQGGIAIVESVPHLMDAYQHHGWRQSDTCGTLTVGQNNTVRGDTPLVCYSIQGNMIGRSDKNGPQGDGVNEDVSFTLNTTDRHAVACYRQGGYADYVEGEVGTLRASGGDYGGGTENLLVEQNTRYIVRRLTPLECERLQGYPDGWTDIGEWTDSKGKAKQTSDAARYKALGNSIALPPWKWVLKRLCACYERDATMASLFDGIGGFPYLWEQLNGKDTCLWASEIEEFPMAVTKVRIGE